MIRALAVAHPFGIRLATLILGARIAKLAIAADVEIRAASLAGIPEADPFTGRNFNRRIACKTTHGRIKLDQ